MRKNGWKGLLIEGWAFIAVAVFAFAGGLLIGDLGASPKTEAVLVAAPSSEGEEAEATEAEGGGGSGAQIFVSTGCGSCHTLAAAGTTGTIGPDLNEFLAPDDTTEAIEEMIVDPNSEIAEGYPPNVMPETYSESLSKTEVNKLAEYLVATTPAKPNPK